MRKVNHLLTGCLAAGLLLVGCATEQTKGVNPSPFLGDAAPLLVNGANDQALLRYVKPGVNWDDFQNVIVDPVTYWIGEGENDGLTPRLRQDFVNYLNTQLRRQLTAQNWTLRDTPTAHTLRLSVALINTHHPSIMLAATAGEALADTALASARTAAGTQSVGGVIHGEMKITNSVTNEIYAAAADQRRGDTPSATGTVDAISKAWVQQMVIKLCMLQNHQNCSTMPFSDNAW